MPVVAALAKRRHRVGKNSAAPAVDGRIFDAGGDDVVRFVEALAKCPEHVFLEPVVLADRIDRGLQISDRFGAFDRDEPELETIAAPKAYDDRQQPGDDQRRDDIGDRDEDGMRHAEQQVVQQAP